MASLFEWKKLLGRAKHNTAGVTLTRSRLPPHDRFFCQALELMDSDVDIVQQVVRLMAQDPGLDYLHELTARHIPQAISVQDKETIWLLQVQPVFKILAHPRVVESHVLEHDLATLYQFVQGVNSKRMGIVFDFVFDILSPGIWPALHAASDDTSGIVVCELALGVLSRIMDCNTSNMVNDHFKGITQRFEDIVDASGAKPDEFHLRQCRDYIAFMRRRLDFGDALPASNNKSGSEPVLLSQFVMPKDLPGHLSASGPRHDNDHANITDIKILPTPEEIMSEHAEYLPSTDTTQFHVSGIRGRLDREFRLLREDTVGQLRDSVKYQFDAIQNPKVALQHSSEAHDRVYIYEDAQIVKVDMTKNRGLKILVQFKQPASMGTLQERQEWWLYSKRLVMGGLLSLLSEDNSVLFLTVDEQTKITKVKDPSRFMQPDELKQNATLADHPHLSYIYITLAEVSVQKIGQAVRSFWHVWPTQKQWIIEFPGIFHNTFQHTLIALQRMWDANHFPLWNLIANPEVRPGMVEVPAPVYTLKKGFSFDLSCITSNGTPLKFSPAKPLDPEQLASHSALDLTQSAALIDALSHSLALIQGPPGTGKSFTGEKLVKVLIANRQKGNLGPILCVCYTNHALDQFLEHLHDDGTKNIIRIGFRSQSAKVQQFALHLASSRIDRTKAEKKCIYEGKNARDVAVDFANDVLAELNSLNTVARLKRHLSEYYPVYHDSLFKDSHGREIAVDGDFVFRNWSSGGSPTLSGPRDVHLLTEEDPWTLSKNERKSIMAYWLKSVHDLATDELVRASADYEKSKQQLDSVSRDVDLRCLNQADVVGVTTTGLAMNLDLLTRLSCKVMLCEEAGEVIEAHALTSLLPSVEQAVLIGDHLQLRPQINTFELQSSNPRGAKYSLDMSLFERLANPLHPHDPQVRVSTLQTQRRMHPSMSQLIRETIYPGLEDGRHVLTYPEVDGMRDRLFWLHHEVPEDLQLDSASTTRANSHEVEMTVALVQHLMRQGSYGADDIAVITPYLGQLFRLRRQLENLFEITVHEKDMENIEKMHYSEGSGEGVAHENPVGRKSLLQSIRLATVDTFQGEEAKVVIISLVRSNPENQCGFLSLPNRINVLLSRAQHGMYIIGNSKTYGHVDMWREVIRMLDQNKNVGDCLRLKCQRHPDEPLSVNKPDDFVRLSPEGGCIGLCDQKLPCGHPCIAMCHSDALHKAVKCPWPCQRPMENGCGHPCSRQCGDECETKCMVWLRELALPLKCGHTISDVLCWQVQNPDSNIRCNAEVEKTVPGCFHRMRLSCEVEVTGESYQCSATCGALQTCGHVCQRPCYKCRVVRDGRTIVAHSTCQQACNKKYANCRHACQRVCHPGESCPPCAARCDVRCSHGRCNKACSQPCTPCTEQKCASECPHSQCTMPCAAPCDRVPCSKRCDKILACGHTCPSVCGEPCPGSLFCQACCSEKIKSTVVDFVAGMKYDAIDLDNDPCIFPDCGHFITVSNLDGMMGMGLLHYTLSAEEKDQAGCPASKNPHPPFSMKEVKACPQCGGSLRSIARYGRIIRRASLDEAIKRFISWSNAQFAELAHRLMNCQADLTVVDKEEHLLKQELCSTKGRTKQIMQSTQLVSGGRHARLRVLYKQINNFARQIREHPVQHIEDFVWYATQSNKDQGEFSLSQDSVQTKAAMQACLLSLKCEIVIISDLMKITASQEDGCSKIEFDFKQTLMHCDVLIQFASATHYVRQEAEGRLYYALFCALSCGMLEPDTDDTDGSEALDGLRCKASSHLEKARELVSMNPGCTQGLLDEIECSATMLRCGDLHTLVTSEEMRSVYANMKTETRGSAHWLSCEHGHPFTSLIAQQCPECGSAIRGQAHVC